MLTTALVCMELRRGERKKLVTVSDNVRYLFISTQICKVNRNPFLMGREFIVKLINIYINLREG